MEKMTFALGMLVGMLFVFILVKTFEDRTFMYKQGQIDALSGNVKFELKVQKNGETIWVRKASQ